MSERPEKKISIVGFTASKDDAPWGDPSFEIWIVNNAWKFVPNSWHRLYDLHNAKDTIKDKEHTAFLQGQPQKHADGKEIRLGERPVFCFEPQKDWPTAKEFPRKEINNQLGRYFTNSISWLIAHALMEGVTELHIVGVDMATGGEYASQRPSCEYLIGIATGMGIKVHIPPQSDLLKLSAMYGAEDDSALHAKMQERRKELQGRLTNLTNQANQCQVHIAQAQGALETTNYVIDVWTCPRADSTHAGSTEVQQKLPEPSPDGKPEKEVVMA